VAVRPDRTEFGLQVAVTDVMVELELPPPPPVAPPLLLPPPQATNQSTLLIQTARISRRTIRLLLANIVWIHVGGEKLRDIGAAVNRPHVPDLLEDQPGRIQQNGPRR
jgi:hypothetical protein